MSSFKTINGVKFEKKLLGLADECVAGMGDGRVSLADARLLWKSACDGPGVTETERATLKHILGHYKCTKAGASFLKSMTDDTVSGASYYKQVGGTKYVRALLDKADTLAKDGKLDKGDALALWKLSMNGGKVTETEAKTVEYFMANHTLTQGAKAYFTEQLQGVEKEGKDAKTPKEKGKQGVEKGGKEGKRKGKATGSSPKSSKKQKVAEPKSKSPPPEAKSDAEPQETLQENGLEFTFVSIEKSCKLKDLCLEKRLPYFHGCGYYQLGTTGKKEKVQAYKQMIARNNSTKELVTDGVRARFGIASGDVQLNKDDVPAGWAIFCQSTSANRVVHVGSVAAISGATTNKKSTQSTVSATTKHAAAGEYNSACAGGRAHFSGCLMGDAFENAWTSECFKEDKYSEYVGVGAYPKNISAFPNAIGTTFDSVAVDAGTRVTIYEKPGFQGKVLWSRIGPAVIINGIWKKIVPHKIKACLGPWKEPLNTIFPPERRELSDTDMHTWNLGSLIISEGEALPDAVKLRKEYNDVPE